MNLTTIKRLRIRREAELRQAETEFKRALDHLYEYQAMQAQIHEARQKSARASAPVGLTNAFMLLNASRYRSRLEEAQEVVDREVRVAGKHVSYLRARVQERKSRCEALDGIDAKERTRIRREQRRHEDKSAEREFLEGNAHRPSLL